MQSRSGNLMSHSHSSGSGSGSGSSSSSTSKTSSGMIKQVYPTAEQALPRRCSGIMSEERSRIIARMTA